MSDELEVQSRGSTWCFTLNRPQKLNALNAGLVDSLLAAVQEAHAAQARLLVFRGAGKSFSAGFDLSDLERQSEADLVLRFVRIEMLLQTIARSPARTLALAHGKVFGAGVDLIAVCRERIASPDAIFRMPGLKFGLVLGTRRFGELVGIEAARQILEDVSPFDAARAQALNFVHEIASADGWDALIERAQARSQALDDWSRQALYHALDSRCADTDLAQLVRSAARPGLKDRLQTYVRK